MKRIGYIYEKIYDVENIKGAIKKASLGKRTQQRKRILDNIDFYANEISVLLKRKDYDFHLHMLSKVYKMGLAERAIICKPKFYPDQIIHWALILQMTKY